MNPTETLAIGMIIGAVLGFIGSLAVKVDKWNAKEAARMDEEHAEAIRRSQAKFIRR